MVQYGLDGHGPNKFHLCDTDYATMEVEPRRKQEIIIRVFTITGFFFVSIISLFASKLDT